jgi:hypothetical protein
LNIFGDNIGIKLDGKLTHFFDLFFGGFWVDLGALGEAFGEPFGRFFLRKK